jgi:SAM-dependent methyltransferase
MILSYWVEAEGAELLKKAHELSDLHPSLTSAELALLGHKRLRFSSSQISQAIEIVLLRKKLLEEGAWTQKGLFHRQAVEQRSHPVIAAHRSERFRGRKHILEIGTGLGFDTAALAKVAERVTSLEANDETAEMARWNLGLQERKNVTVITGRAEDVLQRLDISQFDALFSDPARRDERGRRFSNPEQYLPSLSFLLSLPVHGVLGIKLSPGVNLSIAGENNFGREWIGNEGECKEQVLWRDAGVRDGSVVCCESGERWEPASNREPAQLIESPLEALSGSFLVEPHSALLRSGMLSYFFQQHSIQLIDPSIAYGISRARPFRTAFIRSFVILSAEVFQWRRTQEKLALLGWGKEVDIKKRGFPLEPDEVRKKLKLKKRGNGEGTLILSRIGDEHVAFYCVRKK